MGWGGGYFVVAVVVVDVVCVFLFFFLFLFFFFFLFFYWERGDSAVVMRQTRDRNVAGSSPGRSSGRVFCFTGVNFLC